MWTLLLLWYLSLLRISGNSTPSYLPRSHLFPLIHLAAVILSHSPDLEYDGGSVTGMQPYYCHLDTILGILLGLLGAVNVCLLATCRERLPDCVAKPKGQRTETGRMGSDDMKPNLKQVLCLVFSVT